MNEHSAFRPRQTGSDIDQARPRSTLPWSMVVRSIVNSIGKKVGLQYPKPLSLEIDCRPTNESLCPLSSTASSGVLNPQPLLNVISQTFVANIEYEIVSTSSFMESLFLNCMALQGAICIGSTALSMSDLQKEDCWCGRFQLFSTDFATPPSFCLMSSRASRNRPRTYRYFSPIFSSQPWEIARNLINFCSVLTSIWVACSCVSPGDAVPRTKHLGAYFQEGVCWNHHLLNTYGMRQ